MSTNPLQPLTVDEYLEREELASERHEFLNGEIFMMPGGTIEHSTIGTNIIVALGAQLIKSPCTVRGPDTRIRTSPSGLYTYADASVSCGQTVAENTALLNPVLIVEVLSKSSQDYDRGEKFRLYREISTFCEYLVVTQDRLYIEQHVRGNSSKTWTMQIYDAPEDAITLTSIPAKLTIAEVYQRVLL